jgi:uncharacterized membrane protein YbhN (UPF0104 family)
MKHRFGRILRLLIPVVCLVWLGWIVASLGPRRVVRVAADADPVWLALSFLPILARFLVWGVKWTRMLRRRGPVGFPVALRALMAGVFVNLTTPTAKLAGGFVRAALIRRRTGWRMSVAYGWSLADQVTNLLGNLTLYGIVALGAGLTLAPGATRAPFLVSGAVALAAVVALVSLRRPGWTAVQRPGLARWLSRITPVRFRTIRNGEPTAAWVGPVFEPLLHHGKTLRVATHDLGLAACSFASLCLANAMVLQALGVETPLFLIAVAVVIGYLAGTVIGTVGGIGVTEVALIKLWTAAGVPLEAATAGSLLHRASYYLVIVLVGGTCLLLEGGRKGVDAPPREPG